MKRLITNTKQFIRERKLFLLFAFLSLVIFISNSTYVSYPDEFVNLLGGRAVLRGMVPYTEYFDHHMPLAWYLSAILIFLGSGNFVAIRILWGLSQFLIFLILGIWIYKYHLKFLPWYSFFFVLIPSYMQYFWLHLFIGDALAATFFIPAIIIIFLETLERSESHIHWYLAPMAVTAMIFSSISYLYIGGVMLVWLFYLYVTDKSGSVPTLSSIWKRIFVRQTMYIFLVFVAPYVLYSIYLVVSGSLNDFYYSNFVYNTENYISLKGYVRTNRFNPIRFGLTLVENFWQAFLTAIGNLAQFSFYRPIAKLVPLSLFLSILLFFRFGLVYGFLFLAAISFSAPRVSSLMDARETDYQTGLYLVFGLIASIFVLYSLTKKKVTQPFAYENIIKGLAFVWLGIYLFAISCFLFVNSYHIWYARYMGTLPPIVNYSEIGTFVDEIISDDDYFWVGPFEAQNYYYAKRGRHAGKYPSLLPQFSESELLRSDFINELEKNMPKLIVYRHKMEIFGNPADNFGAFFLSWMKGKYVTCNEIKVTCTKTLRNFVVSDDVYIRNDSIKLFDKLK